LGNLKALFPHILPPFGGEINFSQKKKWFKISFLTPQGFGEGAHPLGRNLFLLKGGRKEGLGKLVFKIPQEGFG